MLKNQQRLSVLTQNNMLIKYKRHKEIIASTVIFIALVILVNFVLSRYLTFLKTSPHSTYEIIVYGILSPFNEAHENILLNFYLLIPAFIATGVYYKRRIEKLVKFRYAFIFSIIATWIMYSKELFIDHITNAAGTSIIGVSLFQISIIAVIDIAILAYRKRTKIRRLLHQTSLRKLILYVVFIFSIIYTFAYWVTYFDNNLASIYLHLTGLGLFTLISFYYIVTKYIYLNSKEKLDLG